MQNALDTHVFTSSRKFRVQPETDPSINARGNELQGTIDMRFQNRSELMIGGLVFSEEDNIRKPMPCNDWKYQ